MLLEFHSSLICANCLVLSVKCLFQCSGIAVECCGISAIFLTPLRGEMVSGKHDILVSLVMYRLLSILVFLSKLLIQFIFS